MQLPSALPSILPAVNRFNFGKQHVIKRLLRGMFKERSTFSRCIVTYDIKYILDYVKKYFISSEMLLELTSKILETVMCLLSF